MKILKKIFDVLVVVIGVTALGVGLWGMISPETAQPVIDALKELLGG